MVISAIGVMALDCQQRLERFGTKANGVLRLDAPESTVLGARQHRIQLIDGRTLAVQAQVRRESQIVPQLRKRRVVVREFLVVAGGKGRQGIHQERSAARVRRNDLRGLTERSQQEVDLHFFFLALLPALDFEIHGREHGDAVRRRHEPLLGFGDHTIEPGILPVEVPADDVDLEGVFAGCLVGEEALVQPDKIRVRRGQDLFEVTLSGEAQELGPSRMARADLDVNQRIPFRCAAVLRVQRELVRAVRRLFERLEQAILEVLQLVEHGANLGEGLLQAGGRIQRPADQAADELAGLLVGQRFELFDGVHLRQLAKEPVDTEACFGQRDDVANLLVRLVSKQGKNRGSPLFQFSRRVDLLPSDHHFRQEEADGIAVGQLGQDVPELRSEPAAQRRQARSLERDKFVEESSEDVQTIEVPIEERDGPAVHFLVARHDLVDDDS